MKNEIKAEVIYQAKSGALELKGDFSNETLWATQSQIVTIFDIERSVATKHINKILFQKEVNLKSNVQKMHTANSDKPVNVYSLDMILAVGYRANSAKAIQFRQWATKTLKQHITEGFTINKKQVAQNYQKFLKAIEDVKKLLLPGESQIDSENILELVKMFASTWFDLDAYDKGDLPTRGLRKKDVIFTADELEEAIMTLRKDLISKNEASDLFAKPKSAQAIHGILGNVFQTYDGEDLYPTVEEKAAHLFYFMVKNHPFSDGNKRSGAFAFVWFLRKVGLLNPTKTTPYTLTALTLLVAESKPADKDRMIGLVLLLIK